MKPAETQARARASMAMMLAIIEIHPDPDALLAKFDQVVESLQAAVAARPGAVPTDDATREAVAMYRDALLTAIRSRRQ